MTSDDSVQDWRWIKPVFREWNPEPINTCPNCGSTVCPVCGGDHYFQDDEIACCAVGHAFEWLLTGSGAREFLIRAASEYDIARAKGIHITQFRVRFDQQLPYLFPARSSVMTVYLDGFSRGLGMGIVPYLLMTHVMPGWRPREDSEPVPFDILGQHT